MKPMKPRQANFVAEKDIEPVEPLHLASIVTSRLHSRNFRGRSCDSSGSNGKLLCPVHIAANIATHNSVRILRRPRDDDERGGGNYEGGRQEEGKREEGEGE